jgi:hypothetical protein
VKKLRIADLPFDFGLVALIFTFVAIAFVATFSDRGNSHGNAALSPCGTNAKEICTVTLSRLLTRDKQPAAAHEKTF